MSKFMRRLGSGSCQNLTSFPILTDIMMGVYKLFLRLMQLLLDTLEVLKIAYPKCLSGLSGNHTSSVREVCHLIESLSLYPTCKISPGNMFIKKGYHFSPAVLNKSLIHHLLLTNKQGLVHLHKVLMLVQDCYSKNKQLPNTGSEKQTITGSESLDHVGMQFALPMLILCCQYNDHKAYIIVLNCRHRVHYSLFKSEL